MVVIFFSAAIWVGAGILVFSSPDNTTPFARGFQSIVSLLVAPQASLAAVAASEVEYEKEGLISRLW